VQGSREGAGLQFVEAKLNSEDDQGQM